MDVVTQKMNHYVLEAKWKSLEKMMICAMPLWCKCEFNCHAPEFCNETLPKTWAHQEVTGVVHKEGKILLIQNISHYLAMHFSAAFIFTLN